MNSYKVYVHIFPNNKRYVGITRQDPQRRWQNGKGYKGQVVYEAIQKYKWHNIEHRILYDNLSKIDAEKYEIELIKEWKTTDRNYGYNVENGGNINKEISAETRQKLSEANKGQIPWIKGKHHTEEAKLKNRNKHLGNTAWNKGIKFSDESRNKMSKAKKELYKSGWLPSNCKKVVCKQTGQVFNSAREAARILGLNSGHVSSCCTGNRKSTGGYNFEYLKGGGSYEL